MIISSEKLIFHCVPAARMADDVKGSSVETDQCQINKSDVGAAAAPAVPPVAKTKYDWYQTESLIIISVMVKNIHKQDVAIDVTERKVSSTILIFSEATIF